MDTRAWRRPLAVLAIGAAVLAACGSDDGETASTVPPVATDGATTPTVPAGEIAEIRPVTVTGEALPELSDPESDPAVGVAAPMVEGASFDGTPVTIGGASERPTLLVFVAHWCPHCQSEIPRLVELQADGRLPADLDVVAVSTATAPDRPNYPPSEWLEREAWPWPALADSETFDAGFAYGLSGFPFVTMLDADGNVVARWSGESDADTLAQQIDAAYAAATA
ncbi:MAG: TlpA family protein disulfide reductase [Ilumatobacteraceae bacterium]|jgi:thiol-disulfide isomerase/thioredoxin|nr:TlpA family protein disulfide reductase [Ilumatobacteraceae bacterium]